MDNKRTFLNMVVVAMLCVLWLQVGYPWLAHKLNWNIAPPPSNSSTSTEQTTGAPTTNEPAMPTTEAAGVAPLSSQARNRLPVPR